MLCRRIDQSALVGLESAVVPLDEDRRPTRIETGLRAGVPPYAALALVLLHSEVPFEIVLLEAFHQKEVLPERCGVVSRREGPEVADHRVADADVAEVELPFREECIRGDGP